MLALAPAGLYARRVIAHNHPELHSAKPHRRLALELRWSWLLEGGARWFAGQIEHAGPAIARRLRRGAQLKLPPGPRDATLLGQTVIDLARERSPEAAAEFVCRFEPERPKASLLSAFEARSYRQLERAWRNHVYALAAAS